MDAVNEDPVAVWKAAELLDMTIAAVYDLVFSRQLASVEAPSGRRLVPRAAIEAWKRAQTSATT